MFSTFLECSQKTGMFYHSVIHGLGFFICLKIKILHAQNNKTRFYYVLYSDYKWVFDQSERAQGPIYILMENTPLVKFIRNYIRDSSVVFAISSLVKISMISLIPSLSLNCI